ncbi:predicted protein [Thalassiosira pseudonana CCMP1335]|uniref:Uncharacterized protein n=1 Tax=Thalassiosira pseudonana TaxID=35128 RepID=B8C3K8_THAPS|nr:predicted protein [Thalassiosira pseudonana CCMP1335]EED92137.1 predicted protein [Thalassiosira pseudonana CCMP1335]
MHTTTRTISTNLHVYAPRGSGYVGPNTSSEDDPRGLTQAEIDQISPPAFPTTYEPMLEYPGTMRPGRTPENMPYHDLPGLGVDDPNPVPWPHFQEIEWHHLWDPPHEQALQMEEFIELEGRWASVEEEAEMRMGMRRGVRERREEEESGGMGGGDTMVIMDDDEEDESAPMMDVPSMMGLGDGVDALMGAKKKEAEGKSKTVKSKMLELDEDEDDDDEGDDFLFDLGLGDEEEGDDDDDLGDLDLDLDDDIDLDGDDDAEEDGDDDYFEEDDEDLTIDDLNTKEDGGDDDEFDDGGFDYDD